MRPPHATHATRGRTGSSIIEFAVVTPVLFGLLVGTFSLGNGLSRLVQADSVCRNANLLLVRGVDMAQPDNQQLVVKAAAGLGLNLPGAATWPDPHGKAAVILTKVIKVGARACAQGLGDASAGTAAATCPNYQKYVIASRVIIGNQTRWQSATGTPASPLNQRGEISAGHIAAVAGNRAIGFSDAAGAPTIVRLMDDECAYISEVFVDGSDLNVPYLLDIDTIRARNVS